ncbi:hypothetical protein PC116_g15990 [Phytophthora cactorum]|uniref:Uncharacterized protein n=1 Tax=Phytophthora cactorum TaxID=29920 RepID=A0A8T1KK07_9STRA|nr:hypothetical protein Pcac1_g4585 [Phytophthora cactorum]KAG2930502.1 hypothetical protein PC114_g2453 [Phytophthora cactorum]KAG2954464.1 hypothetical protein PC117_g1182 [Phytophthora cactorum]KAG3025970.1 hypothetical protein PC120_g6172 [Phytophthora cactorum]KAG3037885.1 hypothetical protein PC119_g3286 [Phytophthora cactorum]
MTTLTNNQERIASSMQALKARAASSKKKRRQDRDLCTPPHSK